MEIRVARMGELNELMALYDSARAFMRSHGNQSQWPVGTPSRMQIAVDIADGDCHVLLEDGRIAGAFSFIVGEDPTYRVIEGGSWRSDEPYAAIHRVASNGLSRGVAQSCFEFCAARMGHLRIDTHEDNLPMQAAIERFGFQRRGIIHIADGSPRIAYDYLAG